MLASGAANTSLEGVTAQTKLRREKLEVEAELKEKRAEYARRMDRVREREEALKQRRQGLQNDLVSFYKYIQENEIKRNRANKKALAEEKAKEERHAKIVELTISLKQLEQHKTGSIDRYRRYVRYHSYLQEVLDRSDNEEFQEAKDIILRYHTLDDNRRVLQRRKEQLEQTVSENKQKLSLKEKRNKNEEVALQYELSHLQNVLDGQQKMLKKKLDAFEQSQQDKGQNVKTIGQVRMACQNLFDRCLRFNSQYRGRVGREESETDMLTQLSIIGDCLEDYHICVLEWRKKMKAAKDAEASGGAQAGTLVVAGGTQGSGAAGSTKRAPSKH